MTLPIVRPYNERTVVCAWSSSIGASPKVATCVIPTKGVVTRVGGAVNGTLTTTQATVAVAINGGSDIASSALTLATTANAVNTVDLNPMTVANGVSAGDTLTFTASGASGSSISGNFWAEIRH